MSYQVGIDLGTTSAEAAVCRSTGTAQVVPLEGRTGAVASVVYLGADGAFLVGEAAERRALSDPDRVVREPTRRIGDGTPLLVGRQPVVADDLVARFLARLVDDVARHEGGVASRVAVTHPGSWGPHRVGSLRAALGEHGLGSALLVPEPEAAAAGHGAARRVDEGAAVAVYDLGGGRFDAAVVRHSGGGFTLVDGAEGIDHLGGTDLDEVVFSHVRAALGPAWAALDPAEPEVLDAVAGLRRECVAAKEALSRDTEVLVPVALPGVRTQVRLGRAEFEEMIRPAVTETVEVMRRVVDAAGVAPADLAGLVLVGGSAQIPLVTQLLSEAFERGVTMAADPVGAVALGAALVARGTGEPAAVGSGASAHHAGAARGPSPEPAADDHSDAGTAVLPVARPPKQARPFVNAEPAPSRPRRIALLASAGALALAVGGGVVAFGASRIGAGTDAGAATPVPVVVAPPSSPAAVLPAPTAEREPAPAGAAQAPRRRAAPVPVTTTAPRPTAPQTTRKDVPDSPDQDSGEPEPSAEPVEPGGGAGTGGGQDDGADDTGSGPQGVANLTGALRTPDAAVAEDDGAPTPR